jgi:hypothetical protein
VCSAAPLHQRTSCLSRIILTAGPSLTRRCRAVPCGRGQVLADVFQADVHSLSTPDAAALGAAIRAAHAAAACAGPSGLAEESRPAIPPCGGGGGGGEAVLVASKRTELAGARPPARSPDRPRRRAARRQPKCAVRISQWGWRRQGGRGRIAGVGRRQEDG